MVLVDSGPLVAIYLPTDDYYQTCVDALWGIRPPMATTKACCTEAMHFLHKSRGWKGQADLWRLVEVGHLQVHAFTSEDLERMRELMEKYRDTPMDLADASLVVLAETLRETHVFTLDSHFHAYRLRDRRALRVAPASI